MAALEQKVRDALRLLKDLGMPPGQVNRRSALCLLALLDLRPNRGWGEIERPLMGITPIMDWCKRHYKTSYAPNTRETFRRQTMHQFVQAGIAVYNPDKPDRPVNSPHAVYQADVNLWEVLRLYPRPSYRRGLVAYLRERQTLAARYAGARDMQRIPVQVSRGQTFRLSAGQHSQLIKEVVEQFAPRFVPGARLVYVGDTAKKWAYFEEELLLSLGVKVDDHGKMPDVVLYWPDKNWLFLVESVTSHGPVDAKRHHELAVLFAAATAGLVYVSAFPNRRVMNRFLENISWETEVWVSDTPTHLIHFNGPSFMGPRS